MADKPVNSGLAIHCHHDILIEYCYGYDERVNDIKQDKPLSEQEVRLRLFKLLPQEAIDELPSKWVKAHAEWEKAHAEWVKTYAEWEKADAEWEKADRDAFHKKWCGCSNWTGSEISFKKE